MTKICLDAFKNLNVLIQNNSIHISPCCVSNPTVKVDSIDFYHNSKLTAIRESWNNNQFPVECNNCKQAEIKGLPSRRQGSNSWYKDNGFDNNKVELIGLDFWTGDTCNLRCVICGPSNSSAWKEELGFPKSLKKANNNQSWRDIPTEKIKLIHFNGGEPLLSKEHIEFLSSIVNKNDVTISYNTNASILPTNKLINLWKQFKLVQLSFSIDDIEDRFDYQRYPAKWTEVTNNLQWFIDNSPVNCMFSVNTTVSILNYDNLDNLTNWLNKNFYISRVQDPIEHRQQQVNGIFSVDTVDINKFKIIEFLNSCDKRRGTNWKNTFPKLIKKLS